jgi:hypothetical protein
VSFKSGEIESSGLFRRTKIVQRRSILEVLDKYPADAARAGDRSHSGDHTPYEGTRGHDEE